MNIKKVQKLPVIVEAVQLKIELGHEIARWCGGLFQSSTKPSDHTDVAYWLTIPTLEGNMKADLNDWIIKGVKGEFYPCKPDIFRETYVKITQDGTIE